MSVQFSYVVHLYAPLRYMLNFTASLFSYCRSRFSLYSDLVNIHSRHDLEPVAHSTWWRLL